MRVAAPVRLCISDLHLDDALPERTQALVDLLDYFGPRIEELYILGDLFNYWIGDDQPSVCAKTVSQAIQNFPYVGWIFGNRDFLLGSHNYFEASGITPLPEVHRLDMAGKPALMCHGDQLCTDDKEHQRYRSMYVQKAFQDQLLSKSMEERLWIACKGREDSRKHKQFLDEEIVDVNQQAVEGLMAQHKATLLVHGHTHRPALHKQQQGQRMVLGEWTRRGWAIVESLDRPHISLASFSIPFHAASWRQLAAIG